MRVTDEDIWNFSDEHRQALRGIQRFLVSVEGVRLWTDFVAGKMPEDRSALPPIPGLRPALRRRLPTEAQRTAHQKKARSPTRAMDVDESPAKRLRSASASARRKSPAARSPRRRERSPDRQQRARSPPASRRRRSPSSDRPIPVPQGLSDYTGPERFMPAGSEGRTPLPRTSTVSASTVTTSASSSGARPRTDRPAAGDAPPPPPQPPVSEIVTPPPGLYQYVGVLFSMLTCRATAHVRVCGVLTTGVGEVLLTPLTATAFTLQTPRCRPCEIQTRWSVQRLRICTATCRHTYRRAACALARSRPVSSWCCSSRLERPRWSCRNCERFAAEHATVAEL